MTLVPMPSGLSTWTTPLTFRLCHAPTPARHRRRRSQSPLCGGEARLEEDGAQVGEDEWDGACSVATSATRSQLMPAPSSDTETSTRSSMISAPTLTVPVAFFPAATRRRGLDPVVDRVDQEMAERLSEEVDYLPVELNVFAHQLESHILPHSPSQVTDELGEGRRGFTKGDVGEGDRLILDLGDGRGQSLQLLAPGLPEQRRVGSLDRQQRGLQGPRSRARPRRFG